MEKPSEVDDAGCATRGDRRAREVTAAAQLCATAQARRCPSSFDTEHLVQDVMGEIFLHGPHGIRVGHARAPEKRVWRCCTPVLQQLESAARGRSRRSGKQQCSLTGRVPRVPTPGRARSGLGRDEAGGPHGDARRVGRPVSHPASRTVLGAISSSAQRGRDTKWTARQRARSRLPSSRTAHPRLQGVRRSNTRQSNARTDTDCRKRRQGRRWHSTGSRDSRQPADGQKGRRARRDAFSLRGRDRGSDGSRAREQPMWTRDGTLPLKKCGPPARGDGFLLALVATGVEPTNTTLPAPRTHRKAPVSSDHAP